MRLRQGVRDAALIMFRSRCLVFMYYSQTTGALLTHTERPPPHLCMYEDVRICVDVWLLLAVKGRLAYAVLTRKGRGKGGDPLSFSIPSSYNDNVYSQEL